MKKLAIAIVKLEIVDSDVIQAMVPPPCRVRHAFVVHEPVGIMVTKNSQRTKPVPHLVVEIDPDAPAEPITFILFTNGSGIDLERLRGELEYGATVVNPNDGRPLVIYKIIPDALSAQDTTVPETSPEE